MVKTQKLGSLGRRPRGARGFRGPRAARPGYFMELTLVDGQVASIRDFRYVSYIARDAASDFPADREKIDIG